MPQLPSVATSSCESSRWPVVDPGNWSPSQSARQKGETSHAAPRRGARFGFLRGLACLASGIFTIVFAAGCGGGSGIMTQLSATANPQVALYTVYVPRAASVMVRFGPTLSYGRQTWTRDIPEGGGAVGIFVAGMIANTTYHVQAVVTYSDGGTFYDQDHTFDAKTYPAIDLPVVKTTTAAGQTPQPGIEIVNSIGVGNQIAATDLQGNVIWSYYDPQFNISQGSWLAPKLLPNGDFIGVVAPPSSEPIKPITEQVPASAENLAREFDLAGDTIKQITMTQLNAALAAKGYNLTLQQFSHDITVLPNGHWIVIATLLQNVVLSGQTAPTQVLGDVIVDLDTNLNPVWVWNEFDHLDVNRHPWNFPDWTHTNAVIYSPTDGNLVVSIRHQNWIVKVNYADGAGNGDILWHLGAGGDLKLVGGTDPTDWQYAQHGMNFTTTQTAGVLGLVVYDNGDDRVYPGGDPNNAQTCGVNGNPACYSTVPVYQIDESAKTATIQFHQKLPSSLYSFFGGDAMMLANGDIEYDNCGLSTDSSEVDEVTDSATPQAVWTMQVQPKNYSYRAYRIPSLYPGVQW
ncbi:MAG TPA: aryl-sulfate sulfotransferase [Acidobacteriaceae bacterium]|nr:aryl-sulfate sulfotransferase [Acidobacteriaceae bacterium]